jgi:hypothetical protein
MRRRPKIIALVAGLMLAATAIYAQTTSSVNPAPGSIWTYFGPTFGAGWGPAPVGAANCANIQAYGGLGDGVSNNAGAWTAALAAGQSCVSFPAGRFRFDTAISYSFPAQLKSLRLCGAGQDVTELYFPNAVGNAITLTLTDFQNSFHVCDLTISTGKTNADTGLYVNQTKTSATETLSGFATSDVTRVTFRGADGYAMNAAAPSHAFSWKTAFHSLNASVIDFVGVSISSHSGAGYATLGGTGGTGLLIEGNGSTVIPGIFNVARLNAVNLEYGIQMGKWVQGIQVTQSNFTGGYAGIRVPPDANAIAQLSVNSSQFNNHINILTEATIPQLMLNNNLFYVPSGGTGVLMLKNSFMTNVVGNAFSCTTWNTGTGFDINPQDTPSAIPPVLIGNTFACLNIGVQLGTYSTNLLLTGNICSNNLTNILNISTAVPPFVNHITGCTDNAGLKYAIVTGAANNGSGVTRLSVDSTAGFVSGMVVLVGGVGGINFIDGSPLAVAINVVDGTHMDLTQIAFSGGPYTTGGKVTTLPP